MKFLAAIDGSDCSKAIIDHCMKCSWKPDSQFKVVSVVDFFEPLPALAGMKKKEVDSSRDLVEKEASRLITQFPGINVGYRVLDGYTKSEIVNSARDWQADLIILGTHGRSGFQKLLLGSVSQAILNHSACSVRIVRSPDSNGNGKKEGFEVMLCMDESKYSKVALERLLKYSWPEDTQFTLVTVLFQLPSGEGLADNARMQLEDRKKKLSDEADHMLERAEDKIKEQFGDKTKVERIIAEGDARDRLLDISDERKPDLVMMGSHGRGAFDRALIGSVSEAMVNLAKCSVEIVRD